jgi:hypothetical protein
MVSLLYQLCAESRKLSLGEIPILDSSGNVERVIPFTETDRRL